MFNDYIAAGTEYLLRRQQKEGNFLSLSSINPKDFSNAHTFQTTFATSLILSTLNNLDETRTIKQIKKKAAAFLHTQKTNDWSFNYWRRESKEAKIMPYPDDLDDTFCALSALFEYNPKLLDGAAFAKIISLLTAAEVQEGGPYQTWLVTKDSPEVWRDVDIAVNSNIAYFLSLQEIELENMTAYIESAIAANKLISPYYYSSLPILYFISRFYKGKYREKLLELVVAENKHNSNNSLHTALTILTLLNLNGSPVDVAPYIESLLIKQKKDLWEAKGFYIDPVIAGKKHYAGSSELTTAFCILAIDRYSTLIKRQSETKEQEKEVLVKKEIHAEIIHNIKKRFAQKNRDIKHDVESILQKILSGNMADQITLLPFYLATSSKFESTIPTALVIQLGTASLYGWIAYTFYDNFLDDEGEPAMLPIANIALRELTAIFITVLGQHTEFIAFFHETMDNLEQANSWEVHNCRLNIKDVTHKQQLKIPDYGDYAMLANRSMGHAIAPAAILFYLGYTEKSPEIKQLLKFFRHYIIAKQLNDDAHDFAEDMKRGHINAVGAVVVNQLLQKKKKLPNNIDALVQIVNEQFWHESVVTVCQNILIHSEKARRALLKNPFIKNGKIFEQLLASIDSSAHKALEEHTNVTKFLQEYNTA